MSNYIAARLERRARNKRFIADLNAQTTCANCGAPPVEWHNAEHVALNRQRFRISRMVTSGVPIEAIKAELARCTPLCRRCHMAEDGRLAALAVHQFPKGHRGEAPKPCAECSRPYKPLRRGLCAKCNDRRRWPGRSAREVRQRTERRRAARLAGTP